jgi:hypothetical protein
MAAGRNVPVLVGPVPLMQVQTIAISEGYRVERIAGSAFSQAVSPSPKTISIDAVLSGRTRLIAKKGLEILAFTSRAAVAAAAPLLSVSGIPVISPFTIALDMQITDLKFTQSATKRDAVDVAITLVHVPRSAAMEIASEIADLALAGATAAIPTTPEPNPIPRRASP